MYICVCIHVYIGYIYIYIYIYIDRVCGEGLGRVKEDLLVEEWQWGQPGLL